MTTHDLQFIAGDLALDFVNTIGNRLGSADEYLRTSADVTLWTRLAGLIGPHQSMRLTARQLGELRSTRERLYDIVRPLALGGALSAAQIEQLDGLFARVVAKRRLVFATTGVEWEWRAGLNDPARVLGPVLASACALFVSGSIGAIRECEGEHCGWLFLDRSPAGRRRWCSMSDCGNRAKARRHYGRQRDAGA